jgi:DNA-binding Lrp family transcriptional regulator
MQMASYTKVPSSPWSFRNAKMVFMRGGSQWHNWIHLPQSEIAEILNMKRPHVSRAMRDLERVEVILRGPKVGRSFTYRINPNFGWKGSAKNHNAALKERMKERGMSIVPPSAKTE